jgi:hypothetical protein
LLWHTSVLPAPFEHIPKTLTAAAEPLMPIVNGIKSRANVRRI